MAWGHPSLAPAQASISTATFASKQETHLHSTPASELTTLAGVTGDGTDLGTQYSWELDYRAYLEPNLAWSISWINEGHERQHHRDGIASQVWVVLPSYSKRFSLALGVGAYHYFDTELLANESTVNTHGWTPIYSLTATYYLDSPWFVRLAVNRINRANDLETHSMIAGLGYAFRTGRHSIPAITASPRSAGYTITTYLGQSIVNTAESEDAMACAIELRTGLTSYLEWSGAWIYEGEPEVIRRNGFTTQLWLGNNLPGHRFGLSLGLGPYLYFDRKRLPTAGYDSTCNVAVLVSPSINWHLSTRWEARLTWNRVVSNYDRDADVFLFGVGYHWNDWP